MNTPITVDINDLILDQPDQDYYNVLTNVPDNRIITGSCKEINIRNYFPNINLLNVNCKKVIIDNQHDIMNIKFPANMEKLYIYNSTINMTMEINSKLKRFETTECEIISLTGLPDEITYINFWGSKINSLIELPEFLKALRFHECKIQFLPKFPKSLQQLFLEENDIYRKDNDVYTIDKFPKSLRFIRLNNNNNLEMLPKLPHNVELSFFQDSEIEPIVYDPTIVIDDENDFKMKIKGYEPIIQSQDDYDDYMNFIKRNSRVKRA